MKPVIATFAFLIIGLVVCWPEYNAIVGQEPPVPQPQPQPQPEIEYNPEIVLPEAQQPQLQPQSNTYSPGQLLYFSISDTTIPIQEYVKSPAQIKWTIVSFPPSPISNFKPVDGNLGAVFTHNGIGPSEFTILASVAVNSTAYLLQESFTITPLQPIPPTPPDPDPPVPPNPPTPTPEPPPIPNVVKPAPIVDPANPGLRILVLEEVDQRSALPRSQISLLTSTTFRAYLNQNTEEWRLFDDDANLKNEKALWQSAFKLYKTSDPLPWILISNDAESVNFGYKGPLPKTEAETIQLISQFVTPAIRP